MSDTTPTPLCRDDDDPTTFCRFATVCHDDRQRIQARYLLRGNDCWAYQLLVINGAYDQPGTPATP